MELPCMKCCGICPDPSPKDKLTVATYAQEQHDAASLYQLFADSDRQINTHCACSPHWCITEPDGATRISVYTDGSCQDPKGKYARAGWGVCFGGDDPFLQDCGPLLSTVQTSYRAEVRAVAQAIARVKTAACIHSDCKSVVQQIHRYLGTGTRPSNLPSPLVWKFIFDALDKLPKDLLQFKWIPGHLDEQSKRTKYQHLLDDGTVTEHDVRGNVSADKLADGGTRAHLVSPETLTACDDRQKLTELIQQHLVASWHNWIVYTNEACIDKDTLANGQVLQNTADQLQDFHDELFQYDPFNETLDRDDQQNEEDPFGHGPMDIDGGNATISDSWQMQVKPNVDISRAAPLQAIPKLKLLHPERPWSIGPGPHVTLYCNNKHVDAKNKPPHGLTLAETHAIAQWVDGSDWTVRHDEYDIRPPGVDISLYQCTYLEAVLALEADTQVCLGGPGADWKYKAQLFEIAFKSIHNTFDIRVVGNTLRPLLCSSFRADSLRILERPRGYGTKASPEDPNGNKVNRSTTPSIST